MSFILTTAEEITCGIDAMVEEVCPGAGRQPKYGGILFEAQAGNPKSAVCGHFVYENHVSLEFSQGHALRDPDKVLEGKGKFRRHIKLTCHNDLADKGVLAMLEQAFAGER